MSHVFPLKEIALQSGLSLATVDRVMHNRSGVREVTVAKVRSAIGELDRQRNQTALSGRQLVIDIVMEAPDRFSKAVRSAIEAELPALRPANIRCRFHCAEYFGEQEIIRHLARLAKRGTNGVILKAADTPNIRAALEKLKVQRIAVITLVTDIGTPNMFPYVGMDNTQAGATAAWCLGHLSAGRVMSVLVALSSDEFSAERSRLNGFEHTIEGNFPHLSTIVASGGFGGNHLTKKIVGELLDEDSSIAAVYSTGGGNRSIISAFQDRKRPLNCFVGHDLDEDNKNLLTTGEMQAVIHHDLRQDARTACQLILKHNQMLPDTFEVPSTRVEICTIHNLPRGSDFDG